MHNLQLTEDQEMVVDTVRKLVSDDVAPKVQELDEHRTFVREWFDGLAELGVYALSLAEDSGGAGMGLVPYVAALEAVGEHSGSLARLWIGQAQSALAMEQAGADLDEVAAGAKLAVFVGPEHGFELKDGKLHGAAELVPAAMEADVLFVAARDGDAPALVQVDAAACQREALHSLGLNSAACGRVTCDGVAGASLDNAAAAIARAELAGFLGVAAASVGGALGAIRELHVRERGPLRVRRVRGVIRRVRTHRVERGVIRQTAVRVQTAVAAVRRSLRERGERTLARAASHAAVRNGRDGRDASPHPLVD